MKQIDINISKAKIEGFNVDLNDDEPIVRATIGLYSGDKKITTYSVGTQSWQGDDRIELRVELIAAVVEMAKELEIVVTRHCQSSLKQLEVPKENDDDDDF